jgi:hypothetical protein
MRRSWILLAFAAACGGDDTTGSLPVCPEVCAEYDVTVSDQQGCDDTVSLDWIEGPLQVGGEPALLGFDFGEVAMAGSYDPGTLDVFFSGIKAVSETSVNEQTVSGEGVADEGNDGWTIDGTVTIETKDAADADCEVTASFLAVEQT